MAEVNPNSMSVREKAQAGHIMDLSDFYSQVEDTYNALRAFNFLLEHMNELAPGGVQATISCGLAHLLRRQVDDFEEISGKVLYLLDYVKNAEIAVAELIAQNAQPERPDDMVILPTFHPSLDDELRARAVAQQSDLAGIARDANVEEAAVRRVMERLLAEPKSNRPPGPRTKSVRN